MRTVVIGGTGHIFNEVIRRCLKLIGDKRQVYSDPEARYFGAKVDEEEAGNTGPARRSLVHSSP